ncbi:MAG: FHA domain-containing protein [Planctomycetes bacterium]|nr:FHA domain-containing protein [Planctomycetota bacterium]
MPHLAIQNPDGDKRLNLDKQSVTIGRARENIVVISHKHVSRRHCVIERHDDSFQLRDLGSLSGTLVNGKSVSIITLSDNDRIQIGPFELWFYDSEPTEDMPSQSGDSVSAMPVDDSPTGVDVDPMSISPSKESGKMPAQEDDIDEIGPEAKASMEPIPIPTPAPAPGVDAAALDALRAEHDRIEAELKDRIDTLEKEHATTQSANQDSASRIDSLTTMLETKEKKLQTLQSDLEQRNAELSEKDNALKELRDTQTTEPGKLTQANQDLEAQVTGLKDQIKQHDDAIKRVSGVAEEEKLTLDKQRTKLEKLEKKLTTRNKKQEREEEKLSSRLEDQTEKEKHLQERITLHEQEVDHRGKEIEAKEAASEKYATELRSRLEQTENELESKRETLDLEQQELKKEREALSAQIEQMQAEWKQHEERAAVLVDDLLADQRTELEKRQEELATEHEAIEATRNAFEAKDRELEKERSELEKKIEEAAVSRQALDEERKKFENNQKDLREFEEKLGRRRDLIKSDRARIEQEFEELTKSQTSYETQRIASERDLATRLVEIESRRKDLAAREEKLAKEFAENESRAKAIESDRTALENQRRDLTAQLELDQASLAVQKQAIEDERRALDSKLENERKELAASMEEIDRQLTLRETEQSQREQTLQQNRTELETKQANFKTERQRTEELQATCEQQQKDLDERTLILDLRHKEMEQNVADAETKMGQFHRQSDDALKALDSKAERITQLNTQIAELKRELASSAFDRHEAQEGRQEIALRQREYMEKIKQLEAMTVQVSALQEQVSQYQTVAANAGDLANQAYRVLNILRGMVERLHDSLDRSKALQANLDEKSRVMYGLTRNISSEYRLDKAVQDDVKKQRETVQAELESLHTQRDETLNELFENVHRICALSMLRRTELPQPPDVPVTQPTTSDDPPDNSPTGDQ